MFRLALKLGCTVGELSEKLTSDELTHWVEFFNLEPWGCDREDWRMGTIAATVANCTPREKGSKPMAAQDFYSTIPREEFTPEQRAFLEKKKRAKAKAKAK